MATATAASLIAPPDRRTHARRSGADLPSLSTSRLQQGPSVALIDLSASGALIEAGVQLKPGASLSLVVAQTGEPPDLVPMRVLRCEVAALRPKATIYRGGCEFVRTLEWSSLADEPTAPMASVPPASTIRLDASLKLLAERCRVRGSDAHTRAHVLSVLNSLHARAAQLEDPFARPLAALLPPIVRALERREPVRSVLAAIEAQIRLALPRAEIRLLDTALPARHGSESIIFRPERATDQPCVLNVQLPDGATLTDWQFRLLKTSMHLCSLVDATGSDATTEVPSLLGSGNERLAPGLATRGVKAIPDGASVLHPSF
jgi:hypothetical protein